MFVTLPQLAFPMPPDLGPPGACFWSAIHFTYPHPWFIATFSLGSGRDEMHRTWGIASDLHLVQRIEHPPTGRLIELLCILPPRDSPTRRWSSREVASVWRVRDPADGREAIVFQDVSGLDFIAGLQDSAAVNFPDRQLVIAIPQKGSRTAKSRPR